MNEFLDTRLTHLGRAPSQGRSFVNPPVQRGSTVLFGTMAALNDHAEDPFTHHRYGRQGTPTHRALEGAMRELEGGAWCYLAPSGLGAITLALSTFATTGCHFLITDNCYHPTREYARKMLSRFGVDVEFFNPDIGAGIADLFRPNTRVLYMESPGSVTFEMSDISIMCAAAKARGIVTIVDATWGTPLFLRPLALGADISIHSATKYIMGHADAFLGTLTCAASVVDAVKEAAMASGMAVAPEDAYLALRGLRTLGPRMRQHQETARVLCDWLATRPEVDRVLYPALRSDHGHDIWKREFTGASGLFSAILKPVSTEALAAMAEGYSLFRMGYSWGGYESLVIPDAKARRDVMPWPGPGPVVRFHAGLEDARDLIADLESGFRRLSSRA